MFSLALASAGPATPGNYGPYWPFARAMEVSQSDAGVNVTAYKSLAVAAVFACVRIIAFRLGALQCYPYLYEGKSKSLYEDSDIYPLMLRGPNPRMTFMSWIIKIMHDVLLVSGNSYSVIERGRDSRVLAIWPQNPARVTMRVSDSGNDFVYDVMNDNGSPTTYAYDNILHIRNIGCDGYIGYTPLSVCRETFGTAIALQSFSSSLYRNGVRPSGVFKHPQKLKPEPLKNLKEQLAQYAGSANTGKTLILEDGLEWSPMSMNMHDAQFIDQQKLSRRDIASIFNVPPKMIGDTEAQSYGSAEADARWFVDNTLLPWAEWIEQEMNVRFFPDELDACMRFDFTGLLRGDAKTRAEANQIMRRNGALNSNEWRESEDMNRIDGDEGETYVIESNMTTMDRVGQPTSNAPPPDGPAAPPTEDGPANAPPADDGEMDGESVRAAHRRVFVEVLDRMAKIEATSRARAEKAGAGACAAATDAHYKLLVSAMGATADAFAAHLADRMKRPFDEAIVHQATRAAAYVAMQGHPTAEACVDEVMRIIAEAVT